jgi:hypothetical protein
MHLPQRPGLQLTYCTNIHPSNGWSEVLANLERYAVPLKQRLAPEEPFGIGLRLSGAESAELVCGDQLPRFREFLAAHGLYVFTMNGFPYGPFHDTPVKADVHTPDWRTEERVQYTLRLIDILAALLPDGAEGSISTSPLSYKSWVNTHDEQAWRQMTNNVVRVVAAMVAVRERRDCLLHLDLEPEPDGLLERSDEVVTFFEQWLLRYGAEELGRTLGVSQAQASEYLLNHVRVCFDTCHVAMAYEDPAAVLDRFAARGINIGKVQISSALRLLMPDHQERRLALQQALLPFAESTYLHQVVQRNHNDVFRQYPDLPQALPHIGDPGIAEWRVHFHVPIFIECYGAFLSTQAEIAQTLAVLRERHFARHLEIETYTWGVLPPALKIDLLHSLEREYRWVLGMM